MRRRRLAGDPVRRGARRSASLGIVAFAVGVPLLAAAPPLRSSLVRRRAADDEGWAKLNRHYWRRDYPEFARFFFEEITSEPHSTKAIEDTVEWAVDGSVDAMLADMDAPRTFDREAVEAGCRAVRCPMLLVHGTEDTCQPPRGRDALAELTGAPLVVVEGADHMIPGRHPVLANLLIRDFVRSLARRRSSIDPAVDRDPTWTRALARRRRALYISSPIGLGHAQRDVAIAGELRKLRPDVEIDWLAQSPVTAVLEAHGERIHPLSAELASESAHITAESSEHDLNAFQAIRRMDEILVANFMVFHDAIESGEYDLVIGDEAWDVDYFLHENPELKRTAFAWMTDFVGWLPMPSGGDREAFLTSDYNAEMIEQVERFPRIRDRAIFVGEPDDIVPDDFGPGLGPIRDWTERHFDVQRVRDRVRPDAARSRGARSSAASSATSPTSGS